MEIQTVGLSVPQQRNQMYKAYLRKLDTKYTGSSKTENLCAAVVANDDDEYLFNLLSHSLTSSLLCQ